MKPQPPDVRPLDRASPLPLWAQLHGELVRRLNAGAFVDGFPGEHEIQQTYTVSRHTVREAMRRIRDAGLVESGRGRPTRVRPARLELGLGSLYSLFREVEALGMEQRSTVLSLGMSPNPTVAVELDLPVTEPLFHLERVRFADGTPLAHDQTWLPAEVGAPLLDTDFERASLYEQLERLGGRRPDGGRERITAVVLDLAMSRALGAPGSTAGLQVHRVGTVDGHPMEYRRSTIRADRYSLVMDCSSHGCRVGATTQVHRTR
ncbi:GntR family transcriptional regulator [Ornithinimicrobium sediminis]|uniref:GntR family transcriptional regulator n=1 Tax=Ornithinimicrobium sediminis TaxID=2904603 RepID=UPI001E5A38F1|nr:GntR family transcriptional regulator [Ornithinimicrobium sediminis]MCE0486780.1 GntR family transcriptional regulator [Ornithinimicrobium sediminis]